MKSDQILFHPVAPKRQASQNNRLANGTTIQNELAPTRPATPNTVGKCFADFPEQNNIKYNTMKLYVIKMWQNNLKLSKQNISLV